MHGRNPQNLLSLVSDDDVTEKWLVVDYDNMNEHSIDVDTLREEAQAKDYTLVVNKPNFEMFILAHFKDIDEIKTMNQRDYARVIDESIDRLNAKDEAEKGFTKEMLMPPYSKKLHQANKLFGLLLSYHPELIARMIALKTDTSKSHYTEMPAILNRIRDIFAQK